MKKQKSQKKVNRQILARFTAEITRITNYPISQDTINQAIKAVESELDQEEASEKGKEAQETKAD